MNKQQQQPIRYCYDMEGENRVHRLRYKDKREGERCDIYTRWLGALCPTGRVPELKFSSVRSTCNRYFNRNVE